MTWFFYNPTFVLRWFLYVLTGSTTSFFLGCFCPLFSGVWTANPNCFNKISIPLVGSSINVDVARFSTCLIDGDATVMAEANALLLFFWPSWQLLAKLKLPNIHVLFVCWPSILTFILFSLFFWPTWNSLNIQGPFERNGIVRPASCTHDVGTCHAVTRNRQV